MICNWRFSCCTSTSWIEKHFNFPTLVTWRSFITSCAWALAGDAAGQGGGAPGAGLLVASDCAQGSFWACPLPGWAQTKNQPCYHVHSTLSHLSIIANTLGPQRNRRHLADDIFKCIFLNGNVWILIKNSLKFVPKGLINNIPALVQIMAWHLILHIISISLHIQKVNTIPADALSPGHQKPWYQGLLHVFWCTKNDLISLSVQHILL